MAKHYFQHNHDYLPLKSHHRRSHRLAFVQIFATRFVLHVLGGCGAVWGCSEVVGLRDQTTIEWWRIFAACVGFGFLIRWMFQISNYCLMMGLEAENNSSFIARLVDWVEILVVKLILEVFGAAGAIWGFSEIVLLRTPETVVYWRPVAICTLIIFAIRWFLHVIQYARSNGESSNRRGADSGDDIDNKQDSEINDLALTETVSADASLPPPSIEEMVHQSPGSRLRTPQKRYQTLDIGDEMDNVDVC